jgi:ABC-type nitrate/sulfonate/bicarbonate transport system substrate-binding protein
MTRLSALLILGLLVVAGCALPPTAQPTPKPVAAKHVVVGMPVTPPNLPHVGVYLARDLGYFAEEGLDVEIKSFESGVQVLRGGIAGDIDVVGSSSEPVVAAIAQGANLKVIYSYAHALTVSLVVQDAIKTPSDLRGKNMGIQDVGAFREMMSRVVLKQAGLTPEDVHYVPVASANYIQGLLSGQIDTAVLHVDQALNAQSRQAGLSAGKAARTRPGHPPLSAGRHSGGLPSRPRARGRPDQGRVRSLRNARTAALNAAGCS